MLTLVAAGPANAHLVSTGFGPVYDGVAHLFLTPEDLLPVVALALLAGIRGPRFGRALLVALPLAWVAGCIVGAVGMRATAPAAVAAVTIALGALVAGDVPLRLPPMVGLAVLVGLLSGAGNAIDLGRAPPGALGLVGVAGALLVVMSLVAGQVASVRAAWARVVVRVAGSWVASSGLFMLGWSLRGT